MSRLHSRFIPWVLLAGFMVAALTFFSLAAGREALQLPGVFSLVAMWTERPVAGEVRRAVSRAREAEESAKHWLLGAAGQALESEGKKLESLAEPKQEQSQPPVEEPLRLLAHRFTETPAEFKGHFTTDGPPGHARTYFLRGPARWVVDMPGHWRNASPRVNDVRGHFISRVVIDTHESFLRIVFHCTDQAAEGTDQVRLERGPTGFTVMILRPQ